MNWTVFFILLIMAPATVIAWKDVRQARQVLADPDLDPELRELVERNTSVSEFTLSMTGVFAFLLVMSWWVTP